MTPAQLHSTKVSAWVATVVASRLSSSRAVRASNVLMVLAGGWAAYMSRPASTSPLSRSATIQAGAGPSGMGIEPAGCMLGSANAGTTAPPARVDANSVIDAANAAAILPMGDEPNPRAAARSPVFDGHRCSMS